jgi:uncharacterized beta-barrel protein YwiB (DUF1934 family)
VENESLMMAMMFAETRRSIQNYRTVFGNNNKNVSVEKIQVSLKSDTNNGTLHEDPCAFMIIAAEFFLE